MAGCIHSDYDSDETCGPCLSPEAQARAERYRSVAMQFTYGKATFHGPTIGETMAENKKHWEREGLTGDDAPVLASDKYRWV